ncbi:MAG TPA: hypothetical protein ENO23_04065, partial [Alphaproteobacteria bacterium]|nr:hypothetical protein [Alphaproteobacteria bacterium]
MLFTHTTLLVVGAVAVRLGGVPLRRLDGPLAGAGWLLCLVALWIAAAATGAWAPLWITLVPSVVCWGLDGWLRRRVGTEAPDPALIVLADVAVFGLLHLLSQPPAEWTGKAVLAVVLIGVSWTVLEVGAALLPRAFRWAPALLGLAASLWLVAQAEGRLPALRSWIAGIPQLAMTASCESTRVTLPSGSVAWMN